jgi:hypothetical protein
MDWKVITPKLRPDQYRWLKGLSDTLGESMNTIVRKALDYYRKNHA